MVSSSIIPFSSCLQSFPASRSFPTSPKFASCGQTIGASASASVLPMNNHGWSPFGFTGLISLLSKGLSRLSSSTTIQKHRFLYAHSSLWTNTHIPFLITSLADYWKNHSLSIGTFVGNVIPLLFNTPSSSIITFLPRSRCVFISWLQSPLAVITVLNCSLLPPRRDAPPCPSAPRGSASPFKGPVLVRLLPGFSPPPTP